MEGKKTSHLGKLDPAFHPNSVMLEVISREDGEKQGSLSQMAINFILMKFCSMMLLSPLQTSFLSRNY